MNASASFAECIVKYYNSYKHVCLCNLTLLKIARKLNYCMYCHVMNITQCVHTDIILNVEQTIMYVIIKPQWPLYIIAYKEIR